MIWQRISARPVTPASHADVGPVARRIPLMRQDARARCVPQMVVREPEASWWRAQARQQRATSAIPMTTVAVLHDRDAGTEAAVTRLAELAIADELLVVFGSSSCAHPDQHAVITSLGDRLPWHDVVCVRIGQHRAGQRWPAVLDRVLDAGRLPVVVTASAYLQEVAAEVSSYIRADRVLRVAGPTARGGLHQVWHRAEPSIN